MSCYYIKILPHFQLRIYYKFTVSCKIPFSFWNSLIVYNVVHKLYKNHSMLFIFCESFIYHCKSLFIILLVDITLLNTHILTQRYICLHLYEINQLEIFIASKAIKKRFSELLILCNWTLDPVIGFEQCLSHEMSGIAVSCKYVRILKVVLKET